MASAKAGPFARRRAGPSGAAGGLALPSIGEMGALVRRSDLLLAIGVTSILVVLVFPLPAVLLDLLLAVSIIVSVLILMTSLFIEEPLEFSSPDRAPHRDDAAPGAEPRLDAAHPRPRAR